ncbi:MAG: DnaJ family molecular chaperone [Devosia sp.]|uniref:J domain-containing protein n=1 Tax=Devosia sp. TaxID=1871048 RepID=UPI0024C9CA64|nr:DnaJ family molecular chaperone [Devosia sp.]UYO00790.1 MAG: DnaJ family molecular chaperone [Devosia sp.]
MLRCVREESENCDLRDKFAQFLGSFSRRTGLAGHVANILDPDTWLPGGREAAFTLALIALSAKMAVADGAVTASEVRAFNATVEVAKGSEPQVERLFNLAKEDVAGYDAYARKVARFFAETPETLEHVLDGLFFIATADGLVHEAELEYLRNVSGIFGFDDARFEQMASQHVFLEEGVDPYTVLGLSHNAPPEEVRRVYRQLVAEHHPDRLIARGVPEDLVDVATARMAAINLAYQAITRPKPQPLLT